MFIAGWTASAFAIALYAAPVMAGRESSKRMAKDHRHHELHSDQPVNAAGLLKVIQDLVKPQVEFQAPAVTDAFTGLVYRLLEGTSDVVKKSADYFSNPAAMEAAPLAPAEYIDTHTATLKKAAQEVLSLTHSDVSMLDAEEQQHFGNLLTWAVLDMVQLLEIVRSKALGLSPFTTQIREFDNELFLLLDRLQEAAPSIISNVQKTLSKGGFVTGTFYAVGIDFSTDILAPAAI